MKTPSVTPASAGVCTGFTPAQRAGARLLTVTFEVDTQSLDGFTDEYITQLWHISQANPAPFGDPQAGELAKMVGHEIIRRFVTQQPPALWVHQAGHAAAKTSYTKTGGDE